MAAKKTTPKKVAAKKKGADLSFDVSTVNGRTAYEIAKQAGSKYINSPTNRAVISNPEGYPVGSDGFFTKTGGRFRAADQIMTKAYNETKSKLDKKYPEFSKSTKASVTKASAKAKKKK